MVDKVQNLSLSQVISALSYALDLTEGQPAGHSVRCCWIGMHLGKLIGLESKHIWNLYYTLLLKDAGCSSNAARLYELYGSDERQAKKDFKLVDNDSARQVLDFVLKHTAVGGNLVAKTKHLINIARHGEAQSTDSLQHAVNEVRISQNASGLMTKLPMAFVIWMNTGTATESPMVWPVTKSQSTHKSPSSRK